ncbi:MAG TPA: hypothetical protein DCQ06_14620, partial [Myxococcales bacterium]|nr:hypothetical protein [Myxococcales bacterium]
MLAPSHLKLKNTMLAVGLMLFPLVNEAASKPSKAHRPASTAVVIPKSSLASVLRSALRQRATDPDKQQFDLAENLMWVHSSASVGQIVACGVAMQGLRFAQSHNTMAKVPLSEMTKDMAYNLARLAQHHRSLADATKLNKLKPYHKRLATLNSEGSKLAELMPTQVQNKDFNDHFNELQHSISTWSTTLSAPRSPKPIKLALAAGLRAHIKERVKERKPSELASRVLSGSLLLAMNQANHVHYALATLAKSRKHTSTYNVEQHLLALRAALQATRLALTNLAGHRAMKSMSHPLDQLVSIYIRGERACTLLTNWLASKATPKTFDDALEGYRS